MNQGMIGYHSVLDNSFRQSASPLDRVRIVRTYYVQAGVSVDEPSEAILIREVSLVVCCTLRYQPSRT